MFKQYINFDVRHPFNSFTTDPTYNGRFNGMTGAIMQSDENRGKVLERARINPYDLSLRTHALEEALNYYNLTKSDFTESDYDYLIQWTQGIRN